LFTKILQSHTQNMSNIAIVLIGCLFLVIAIIGYILPIASEENYSIPQVVALCDSEMGELGQVFSGEIIKACSDYSGLLMVVYGSGISGLVLIVVGAVVSRGQKEDYHEKEVEDDALDILEKRYAKGEITKEEFDKMKKDLE